MENLTEGQYELALQYMQETGQDNFQNACSELSKYDFNLENALNPPSIQNEDELCQQQQMAKMRRYFLKKVDKVKTKEKVSKKLQNLKRMTGRFCLSFTEKIMPEMIKRKIIRSRFHCMYHSDSCVQLLYRSLQQAIFQARQRKKLILAILSNSTKNIFISRFLGKQKLLKLIEQKFIVFGSIQNEECETILQGERAPQVLFLRENRYQQFEIFDNCFNQEILDLKEDKIKQVIGRADQKLERQKRFMQRTANRLLQPYDIQQSLGTINREDESEEVEIEEVPVNYLQNIKQSRMIKQQNTEYQKMEKQILKKEEDKVAKQRLQQEMKQEREFRRMSLPQEPVQGDIMKIFFRCPNGDGLTRNFQRSERLQLVYNWVELNDEIEFEEKREFDLFYSYPPESLSMRKEELLSAIFEEKQEKIMIKEI